jgi:pimeloyl-ACP methyl ester carboxylesterase
MRKRRRLRYWFLGFAAVALLVVHFGCMSFKPPPVTKIFAGRPLPTYHTYELPGGGRQIFTAETGNPDGPLVLFIHGTPGSWEDFGWMMARPNLAERALLISADRLGWGGSAVGGLEMSLAAQVKALQAVLDAHPKNLPAIIVGWSYGGPVAAQLALDDPAQVGALVLVAASLDPAEEKVAWYQAVARLPGVYFMVSDPLVKADEEIVALKGQLVTLTPRWAEIKMPVTVLQGTSDNLVSPENADFIERQFKNAQLRVERIPNQGHMIPWQHEDLLEAAILADVEKLTQNKKGADSNNKP